MDVTVVDALSAVFSGLAALGGIVAVIVAVRALTIAREAASVEQLFLATGDTLAALQEIGRLGSRLGQVPGGEAQSRDVISEAFERFLAARARVDLCFESLGLAGDYPETVLTLAHNYAAGVLQADEFAGISRDIAADDLLDDEWVKELSWKPSGPDVLVLAQSASFQEVRQSLELIPDGVVRLEGLDHWWGARILEHDSYGHARSVYSIDATYLTQTARLIDDFTSEYVQPMFSAGVRQVARSRRKMKPLQ
ncbi:hypothetical protein [Microbacterium sp. cx-59]|uniref:hypothetical protein n=1 Tax=Microbacterium sp. cx-59 TaxID=2891207 RepID=UPI001E504D0A|nr:hypothetical protein [Microbacterium sp. cx-59]MCC4907763.1 hypothetical protein [Microbacterium sp. cx-59]